MMSHLRNRALCAAGAIALTALSSAPIVFAVRIGERALVTDIAADDSTVEHGRYLVKITGCNDCHTPGYTASAGRVAESQWLVGDRIGWHGPWGTTYPPNLRLLVRDITAQQWLEVARRPMRPPMPWFALRDMSDEDLLAIYHFVRSLGPEGVPAPAHLPPGEPPQTPVVRVPCG